MILLGYTDNKGILLGNRKSQYEPWGSSIQGAWFSSWCVVSIDTGRPAQSTVRPKMESCSQDGACSVCFLLHSPLLMLLTHSVSIIHRDILHPDSLTSNLGERYQPLGYKVPITL